MANFLILYVCTFVCVQVEDEIRTLTQVLAAKEKQLADIKRKLGITPLNELKQNITKTWQEVTTSTAWVLAHHSLTMQCTTLHSVTQSIFGQLIWAYDTHDQTETLWPTASYAPACTRWLFACLIIRFFVCCDCPDCLIVNRQLHWREGTFSSERVKRCQCSWQAVFGLSETPTAFTPQEMSSTVMLSGFLKWKRHKV